MCDFFEKIFRYFENSKNLLTYPLFTMSSNAVQKKPDNIVWIEEVILNNLTDESGAIEGADPRSIIPTANPSKIDNTLTREEIIPSHQSISSSSELKIGIAEIELKDESFLGDERIQTLSRIVTGKIKYFIENKYDDEERYQYWILKMPTLLQPQRQLSQTINAAKREIAFYTEILPDMKMWVESRFIDNLIEFRVPTCFYGRFQRPIDKVPDLDILTHILDSESLLVLDDLRANGFGKRHFGSGLILSEAMAAVDEIVKFHAVSWAMQEIERGNLAWAELYGWQQFGHLYHSLLDNGFSSFHAFIRDCKHPHSKMILGRITKLRPQLLNKLYNLLAPAEFPSPNTLVHMDFWSENILFRMKEEDRENEVPLEEADLDCSIIDWQMVSYGRPTHDLALLVMLSMEPEYRRQHGEDLLKYYYEMFRKTVEYFDLYLPFDYDLLKQEFEKSCVLATLMAMASIDIIVMEESTQTRFLEALVDLIDDKLI